MTKVQGTITRVVWGGLSGLAFFSAPAMAFGGCVDSPENPTLILGLLGAAAACLPWIRAQWASGKRSRRHR